MKNPNEPAHKTRDHRFAYISTGDITRWARGTSRFAYPEPKNTKVPSVPITSKAACVMRPVAAKSGARLCMIGAVKQGAPQTMNDLEGTGIVADSIESSIAISNLINRRFGLIT